MAQLGGHAGARIGNLAKQRRFGHCELEIGALGGQNGVFECGDLLAESERFKGDLVTYTYDVKQGVLGVSEETLKAHGAVSEECVREMAAGVRKRVGAEVGIATSGIAGPDGGTTEKPVGTVCIALDSEDVKTSRRYQMRGTRDWVKLLSSQVALDWMRRYALQIPIEESQLFKR